MQGPQRNQQLVNYIKAKQYKLKKALAKFEIIMEQDHEDLPDSESDSGSDSDENDLNVLEF